MITNNIYFNFAQKISINFQKIYLSQMLKKILLLLCITLSLVMSQTLTPNENISKENPDDYYIEFEGKRIGISKQQFD